MQLILVSNAKGTARSVIVSPGQLAFLAFGGALLAVAVAAAIAMFALQQAARSHDATVHDMFVPPSTRRPVSLPKWLNAKLDSMAKRIGHLQAQTAVLDLVGERVAALAGLKPHELKLQPGQSGSSPAVSAGTPSIAEIENELNRISSQIGARSDYLDILESRFVDNSARKQLLPTMLPVAHARLGSGFGMRIDPFTGRRAMHEGLDLDAPTGTPIMAAGGGIVIVAGRHPEFGNLVEIDHGGGLVSRYAHCSRIYVKVGDLVLRGQIIAAVGQTGRATGPHLHFEIRYRGVAENPMKFLHANLRRLPGGLRLSRRAASQ